MRNAPPTSIFDSGWLFLIAGGVVFIATTLIPAFDDAHAAERQVRQARAWADHQTRRIERYSEYLDALDRKDPTLIASLAATHLHLRPAGKRAILFEDPEELARRPINVFEGVEPPPPRTPPAFEPPESVLGDLARGERSRLILFAGATLCILWGLLPPSQPRDKRSDMRSTRASEASRA